MKFDRVETALVIYLCFITPVVWYVAGRIVEYYCEPSTPLHTFRTLRIGFHCALSMVLLLPVDLASVVLDRANSDDPNASLFTQDDRTISHVYSLFYFVIMIWGSLVLCYQEYLNTDGYFTTKGRLCSALKRMLWDFVPSIVFGVPVLLLLLKAKVLPSNPDGLKLFSQLATNTIYSILTVFLLGFGLVEFPRLLWSKSDVDDLLLKAQTKAATEFTASLEARNALSVEVASVLKTKDSIGTSDPILVEAIGMMVAECPSEFKSSKYGELAHDKNGKITIHSLANLRTRMNAKKAVYRMAQARLETTQMGAYNLEDMALAKKTSKKVIFWSLRNADSTEAEYKWLLVTQPRIYKTFSVIAAFFSLFSFLGIISSMGASKASVYFHVVHSRSQSVGATLFGIIIFVFLTLTYVILVTVYALFQLRSLFELVPGRTTANALSTATRMFGSLTFPVCFFYLGWVAENGIKDGPWMYYDVPRNTTVPLIDANGTTIGTTFKLVDVYMPPALTAFYPMASVPTIKRTYGMIYPLLLFFFLVLILTKAFNRLMVQAKMPTWQFGDPIISKEQLDEGMKQLLRFKKIAERTVQRAELTAKRLGEKNSDYPGLKICGIWIFKPIKSAPSIIKSFNRTTAVSIPPPATLSGTVSYKIAQRGRLKLKWVPIFAIVKEPGVLVFAMTEEAAEKNIIDGFLPSPIDLTLALDFAVMTKDKKEGYRLKIQMVADSIKLRLSSEDDLNRWKRGLSEWKEYSSTVELIRGDAGRKPKSETTKDIEEGGGNVELVDMPSSSEKNPLHALASDNSSVQKKEASVLSNSLSKKEPFDIHAVQPLHKPASLEGYLYKKRNSAVGRMTMSKFQQRYFRVDEELGELHYFRDNDNGQDIPAGSINLAAIDEVSSFAKDNKTDLTRFNISMNTGDGENKTFKLKATDANERKQWVTGLNAWREYFILRYSRQQAELYSSHLIHCSPEIASKHDTVLGTEDNTEMPVPENHNHVESEYEEQDEDEYEDEEEEDVTSVAPKPDISAPTSSDFYESYASDELYSHADSSTVLPNFATNKVVAAVNNDTNQKADPVMVQNPLLLRSTAKLPTAVISSQEDVSSATDEDAYIKSMESKYRKVAPNSTSVPKFTMPSFSMGKTKK